MPSLAWACLGHRVMTPNGTIWGRVTLTKEGEVVRHRLCQCRARVDLGVARPEGRRAWLAPRPTRLVPRAARQPVHPGERVTCEQALADKPPVPPARKWLCQARDNPFTSLCRFRIIIRIAGESRFLAAGFPRRPHVGKRRQRPDSYGVPSMDASADPRGAKKPRPNCAADCRRACSRCWNS
jgi:hypothetical protein